MSARGMYGFRLRTIDPGVVLADLAPVGHDAPVVTIDWRHASHLHDVAECGGADRYVVAVASGGMLEVTRDPATITAHSPNVATPQALVHPLLTTPLSFHARWRGDLVVHGGAFVAGGKAWAVVGEQEAGKSTVLATLASRGVPVVADDLVVLSGGDVLAGPPSVDLRPDAAPRFPQAVSMGIVGGRERFRLPTAPAPARVPFGGLAVIGWRDEAGVKVHELDTARRLAVLHGQHYAAPIAPPEPHGVLEALDRPMWAVRRGRGWERADEVVDQLLLLADRR